MDPSDPGTSTTPTSGGVSFAEEDHHIEDEAAVKEDLATPLKAESRTRASGIAESQIGGMVTAFTTATKTERMRFIEEAETSYLFYPWTRSYKIWWGITVFGAVFTIFSETFGENILKIYVKFLSQISADRFR